MADRGGKNMKMFDTPETRARFRQYGLEMKTTEQCAVEFGCCVATIFNFFNRCPKAREAFQGAKDEVLAEEALARREDHKRHAQWKENRIAGGKSTICPTCGSDGNKEGGANKPTSITIDTATLAEARIKLEKLFSKYAADRDVASSAGKSD